VQIFPVSPVLSSEEISRVLCRYSLPCLGLLRYGSLPERFLCSRFFFSKNLLTQGARCRSRSRMSHLGPGGARSAKARLVLRQRQLGTAWEDVTLSLDAPPALRAVLAQVVHGHHLQDRLISSLDVSQCDHSDLFSRAWSCGLKKMCGRRSSQSISASALVDFSFVHRIREHYPTPQLQHRRPARIGKTGVSDGLSLCSRLMTGLSTAKQELDGAPIHLVYGYIWWQASEHGLKLMQHSL
jgi:hypothetical protein